MLKDKVVIFTGAGAGIGQASAIRFSQLGAILILADVNISGGKNVEKIVRQYTPESYFVACDVTVDLPGLFESVYKRFGRIDMVVNNAGIANGPVITDLDGIGVSDQWKLMVRINLDAVIEGTFLAIKYMKDQENGGVVINTASIAGIFPSPFDVAYNATKSGVVHFSRSLKSIYASSKIRVCALCPGFTDTAIMSEEARMVAPSVEGGIMDVDRLAEAMEELATDRHNMGGGAILVVRYEGAHYWPPRTPKL